MKTLLDHILEVGNTPALHAQGCSCNNCKSGAITHPPGCSCSHCQMNDFKDDYYLDELLLELSGHSLRSAVKFNRKHKELLGWGKYFDRIVSQFLKLNYSPDEEGFAKALASWQARNGLTSDGMLGKNTWGLMSSMLGIKPATPSYSGSGTHPGIRVLMPKEGLGFYCYGKEAHRYGLPETVEALKQIARAWFWEFPGGPRIGIGDLSKYGGGKTSGHVSHQLGLDVDIRPMRNDGSENKTDIYQSHYSNALTRRLYDIIKANPVLKVRLILFNDKRIPASRWPNHDNHLHVRFCLPPGYKARYASLEGSSQKDMYKCS